MSHSRQEPISREIDTRPMFSARLLLGSDSISYTR